jgi:hypothetical protein
MDGIQTYQGKFLVCVWSWQVVVAFLLEDCTIVPPTSWLRLALEIVQLNDILFFLLPRKSHPHLAYVISFIALAKAQC